MTTSSAAQDEFNELIRDKDRDTKHPEDRNHDSDLSEPESAGAAADYLETTNTDDELDIPKDMRSNYYMPSLRSDANTGPKGVIADAQAFEQAKKQAKKQGKRLTWKKNAAPTSYTVRAYHDKDGSSDEDSEDSFMKEWRAARLQELQNVGQKIIRSRTNSPSRRIYGNIPEVDGEGYLDAIDKTAPGTTVVVYIVKSVKKSIDEQKASEQLSEQELREQELREQEELRKQEIATQHMHEVARRNDTVRFVQFPGNIAEIDNVALPGLVAYRGGDKVAKLLPLLEKFPADTELSAVSLENCLRQHRIL